MAYHIVKSCKWDQYIQNSEHAYQAEITSDDHITQLVKTISSTTICMFPDLIERFEISSYCITVSSVSVAS